MLLMGKSTISTGPFSIAMFSSPEGNLYFIDTCEPVCCQDGDVPMVIHREFCEAFSFVDSPLCSNGYWKQWNF